jgi:hypothetical protein
VFTFSNTEVRTLWVDPEVIFWPQRFFRVVAP